jgi:hypothetical protein
MTALSTTAIKRKGDLEALMTSLSTTAIKIEGDLKQTTTSTRLAAADLVLPQPVPLCL